MKAIAKIFKNKKTRLLALLSTNIAVLCAAVVFSTVAWFVQDVSIGPVENMPSKILTGYFDKNVLPTDFDEEVYPHGCSANPYVITRPIHYYNLVRLQELGTYGFTSETYFQFGKRFLPSGLTAQQQSAIEENYPYLFYKYNDNGVEMGTQSSPVYDNYLNMKYYKDSNALSPIGSARHPFEGTVIGNDLTVKNLYIKGAGYSDIGIFGYTSQTSYVHNLYFDNIHIDAANADATALGSIGHAAHSTHVYIGYLAGHIFDTSRFSNVYINNCHIYNTVNTEYEMINTFGFFGHTDEPLGSSEDTSGYTSQLVAENAYNAIEFSNSLGGDSLLARRYTSEPSAGFLSDAITDYNPQNQSTYYTIDTNTATGKPYSLSSIGYSSGDAGTFKYARYNTGTDNDRDLHEIGDVEAKNVLSEKPKYIQYYDDDGNPIDPIDHSNDPDYDFYGMDDGAYIYYGSDGTWKYVNVEADTEQPVNGTVNLYCHTISFNQTVNSETRRYFLKYQAAGVGDEYDTLVAEYWPYATPPQTDEYYFCFKTSFGHTGVSRFVECSNDSEYYIYSPVGQKYLCTYSPKTPGSAAHTLDGQYLHTPVFVPQEGYRPSSGVPAGTGRWMPMKFTLGGPITRISYKSTDNADSLSEGITANDQFNRNINRARNTIGALQGSNIDHEFGLFGGHKMVAGANGGDFIIGDYIENQTTSLNNAVNYKLTSNASEIVDYSTLVIAGYEGEQTNTYSIDYALGAQMDNNRDAKVVKEVRDTSGYVLNDTTGVSKLVFRIVGGSTSSYNYDPIFTIESTDGYLYFPKKGVFTGGIEEKGKDNKLLSAPKEDLFGEGKEQQTLCAQWKFKKLVQDGYYTRYRFQNVGAPDRYLCYNVGSNIFNTYSITYYRNDNNLGENAEFSNNFIDENITVPEGQTYTPYNSRCWFYIYKQQHGQTIQNVHYTVAHIISGPGTTYPFKKPVVEYPLMVSEISNSPTDPGPYTNFDVDPSYNVYFNTTTSQVQYFEAYVRVWKRVNLVSELQEGDIVMIGSQQSSGNNPSHYFMGSQASNYRNRSSSVNFKPPYIQADNVPTNAATFTLTRSDRGWRFDTGSGFLYAAGGSSNNYLRTETQADSNGNADWSISILTDGTANIVSQGRNVTRNKIQYGRTSNSWWSSSYGFTCFSGSQTAIQLYRLAQSSADRSTYVGDLIDKFEPFRMDAIGPNIEYHTDYMKMNQEPSIANDTHLNIGDYFYPSIHFKNAITLLIDANGSRDLGTLKFECRSNNTNMPYFYLYDGTHYRLDEANATDKDANPNDNVHSYLLNINTSNISTLTYYHIKGEGYYSAEYKEGNDFYGKEFKVCASDSEDLTKYLVVLAAPSGCEITNVTFTFNAIPGNIGYPGPVDYRSADYDANGFFTGTYLDIPSTVEETALCIYYDMKELGQQLDISVQFDHATGTYIVSIDTTNSVLTVDLIVNIFKYDNDATQLSVLVDGVPVEYDGMGSLSVTIPANASPGP